MKAYSDLELLSLFRSRESEVVERKRSIADRSAIRRTICAFANDLANRGKPGVVFIGLNDDGSCADLRIDDELLRILAHMRTDANILPFPSISVETKVFDGCEVVVLIVQPSASAPVSYQGRIWVKVGPTCQLATPEEERRLAEKGRISAMAFDHRPIDVAVEELDLDHIKQTYLPAAICDEILAQNQRSFAQQLHSLRLLVGDRPTRGALLAFGRDPQHRLPGAYVQFLRIAGTELGDPVTTQIALKGRLRDILHRIDDILKANILVRTDIASGATEVRRPDYPREALQQIAWNAVMHRSYDDQSNAPVRIYWYADRIEIRNPGGLVAPVSPGNIGTGVTSYRNPLVAELMLHMGFAQRFGFGLPLARRKLRENGNPPLEFDFSHDNVVATIRPSP